MSEDKSFDGREFNESYRELAEFWRKVATVAVVTVAILMVATLALAAYVIGQGL